jgi:hypothetical protein
MFLFMFNFSFSSFGEEENIQSNYFVVLLMTISLIIISTRSGICNAVGCVSNRTLSRHYCVKYEQWTQ